MQNKLHTVHFSHHQFAASPWAATVEFRTCGFCKLFKIHEKDWIPRKVQTPRHVRIQTHRKENISAPRPTPVH